MKYDDTKNKLTENFQEMTDSIEKEENEAIKLSGLGVLYDIQKIYSVVMAKLQLERQEKEYFLPKHKLNISDEAIDTINEGSYIFVYRGKVDGKYDDCDMKKIEQ
ncbi:hypothetical protein CEXT_131871 [Caerostris extrusa]|uniref:Uncharacterized protein n=1 Tax=Caerostris extrusa TaxID=172846 RepID=A0AAV4VW96_CAEEX|nr:hypothetical protein CEXT_131871 [Caerostris extrusa]